MKVGIMQPYFLPYIGYWQLLNAVDNFVVGDNLQFTKKGWMRRNRILVNGKDAVFSLPVKSGSNFLNICDIEIADPYFKKDADKLFRKIKAAYMKAPYFEEVMPVIEECIYCEEKNLFDFLFNSMNTVAKYLEIDTEITLLSSIDMDHSLKREYKVREICKKMSATSYLNAIGGVELYNREFFESEGIELEFIKTQNIEYKQFDNEFVPSLSIVDVMMFNSLDSIKDYLNRYDIVHPD